VAIDLKFVARNLRSHQTAAEKPLWAALRRHGVEGFRFRRQVELCGFIVDFACYEATLIVEVDGATHSTEMELAKDARREETLRLNGNSVLRFTNDDVFHNLEGVLETIRLKLIELRPQGAKKITSPTGRRLIGPTAIEDWSFGGYRGLRATLLPRRRQEAGEIPSLVGEG
jgi:very-short-patch-repair endonuclease